MNYAWKAVLQAEKHNRERDNLRFVEASTPSPYIEVSVIDLNQDSPEGDRAGEKSGSIFAGYVPANTGNRVLVL